jgi:cytochrome c oxidase subunit 2
MLAFIFLCACGEGTDKNKDNNANKANKAIQPPAQQTSPEMPASGSDLFSKYGCFACHSLDGSVMYGPPLNDLFRNEVSVVRKGKKQTIVADREYFKRAIMDPDYEKVSEYKDKIMPKPDIPREDVETLIDYLIELGEEE